MVGPSSQTQTIKARSAAPFSTTAPARTVPAIRPDEQRDDQQPGEEGRNRNDQETDHAEEIVARSLEGVLQRRGLVETGDALPGAVVESHRRLCQRLLVGCLLLAEGLDLRFERRRFGQQAIADDVRESGARELAIHAIQLILKLSAAAVGP